MSIDQWMRLLGILISLLQVIIWPCVALLVLLYLRKPLKKFLENIIEVTLKAGPIETTAKIERAIEAGVSLGAATALQTREQAADSQNLTGTGSTKEIASLVNQTVTPQTIRMLESTSILWVDDVPSNNAYERQALEALGVHFTICTSTEDALRELKGEPFDAIVSDMGRPPDARAGYTLLEAVQKIGIHTPFIIYAKGGNKPENKEEARKRGAYVSVSGPQKLFAVIIKLLTKADE
jgi:CheY-like chemotaxis protein